MDRPALRGDRLTDRSAPPDDAAVREWIGPDAFALWSALRDWIATGYPGAFAPDWTYGGRTHGWSLRYRKSRAFCTLLPEYGGFSVIVVLGAAEREKVEARRDSLGPRLMGLVDAATTYHDGTWLKIGVSSPDDLRGVTALLTVKRPRRAGL